MRRYLLLLFLVFFGIITSIAQTQYEVTAKSSLNVRTQASKDGYLVGTLQHGERIEVYTITNGWAQIRYNGQNAYVNANYIKKCPVQSINQKNKDDFSLIDLDKYATYNVKWLVFIILPLILFIALCQGEALNAGVGMFFFEVIFFLIVALELVYFLLMGDSSLWFLEKVGIILFVINFCVYGYIVYLQILCFFRTLTTIRWGEHSVNLLWGLYSWIGLVVGAIIVTIASWEEYSPLLFILFIVCQIIQICIIFKDITPYGGWLRALWYVIIYVIGSISTILLFIHFVRILIVVLIILFFVKGFLSGSNSDNTTYVDNDGNRYKRIS